MISPLVRSAGLPERGGRLFHLSLLPQEQPFGEIESVKAVSDLYAPVSGDVVEVTGTARPISLGRRNQVWEVRIVDDNDKLVCISRCTMAVIEAP